MVVLTAALIAPLGCRFAAYADQLLEGENGFKFLYRYLADKGYYQGVHFTKLTEALVPEEGTRLDWFTDVVTQCQTKLIDARKAAAKSRRE